MISDDSSHSLPLDIFGKHSTQKNRTFQQNKPFNYDRKKEKREKKSEKEASNRNKIHFYYQKTNFIDNFFKFFKNVFFS